MTTEDASKLVDLNEELRRLRKDKKMEEYNNLRNKQYTVGFKYLLGQNLNLPNQIKKIRETNVNKFFYVEVIQVTEPTNDTEMKELHLSIKEEPLTNILPHHCYCNDNTCECGSKINTKEENETK